MWEGGREREWMEPVEYCESRFLDAWDMGRGNVLRREGGEVIKGGSEVWLGLEAGEDITAGGVSGVDVDDIITIILGSSAGGGIWGRGE